MHRIVLDTCVVVTAFRSRNGVSRVVLDRVADRSLVPLLTPALFLQYEEVLKRPEQLRASRLTLVQVDQILASLASAAEPVTIHYSWRPQLRDPGAELVLEAAVNGRAEAFVTYNLRHFVESAARFGLRLARPIELLEEMRL
ncbi:MAG: putative toxin-antitoxin system toxin component, PIN family [Alphaproteobacteria bacterium]|nr:putative toxin-antitoxin system toxin component, PIN family [Alphaproteobacteria bacterium]